MSHSSILGGEPAPTRAAGRDADVLGPSDTSDTGSDVQGERTMPTDADNAGELGAMPVELDSDSDAFGTGERGSAAGDTGRDGGDILPDRIVETPDVDGDVPIDAAFTDDIEDVGDDDDDDDEGDPEAVRAETSADDGAAPGGRTFTLPPGTLEAVDEP